MAHLGPSSAALEMLFARALVTRTTVRIRHCDFKAGATSAVAVFDQASWQRHLAREFTTFSGEVPDAPVERRRRRGPSAAQEEILRAVRANVAGADHRPVFDLSTKKRSRH